MSNTEYFILYSVADGAVMMKGDGRAGITALQQPPEGWDVVALPVAAWRGDLVDHVDTLRAALWDKAKAKREAVINGGAATPSGAVDSDETSRSNLTGAALAALMAVSAGQAFSVEWTMIDNSPQQLDAAEMMAMAQAVMEHVDAAHARGRALRAALDAAITVQSLLMVDIGAGWSAI